MTRLKELHQRVYDYADSYTCHWEDALVYALEDVVEGEAGVRRLSPDDVEQYVHDICALHDVNSPAVVIEPSSSRVLGRAHVDDHVLCLSRARSSVFTVLHEIAHFIAAGDGHGARFRDAFIRLVREHVSVGHASLYFMLCQGVHLDTSPWESLHREGQ